LVTQRVNTGRSVRLAQKPIRQPVIAQVFEAPSAMIVALEHVGELGDRCEGGRPYPLPSE
jgi:hypothetical protein